MLFIRVIFFLLVVVVLEGGFPGGACANAVPWVAELETRIDGVATSGSEKLFHLASIRESPAVLPGGARASQSHPADQGISATVDKVLLPDFLSIKGMQARKEAFFEFLMPLVQEENRRLLEDRRRILDLRTWRMHDEPLRPRDREWLQEMADRYKVQATLQEPQIFFAQLLHAVDIIPVSLALAQAADESGLGSSRVAKEGNNLFGQVCRSRCGSQAKKASGGRMLRFDSVTQSVRHYIENLNVNAAYQPMRALRAQLRAKGQKITGVALGPGLERYSELGNKYVRLIVAKINLDDLTRFDEAEFLP